MQFVGHTNKQEKFLQEWLVSDLVKHIQCKAKKKEKGKRRTFVKRSNQIYLNVNTDINTIHLLGEPVRTHAHMYTYTALVVLRVAFQIRASNQSNTVWCKTDGEIKEKIVMRSKKKMWRAAHTHAHARTRSPSIGLAAAEDLRREGEMYCTEGFPWH